MLQTEHEFRLPMGYVDKEGTLHREGVMRLATAADEILPLKDGRVRSNEAYFIVILLSRVITRLGSLEQINTGIVENLYAADLDYLQEFYNAINRDGHSKMPTQCPRCDHHFELEIASAGGS